MSRGEVLALVLVATLAVAGVALVAVPRARREVADLMTAPAWALDFWAALGDELPQLSTPARLLLFAHAAYESGWGTAAAARSAHNAFNTTAGPDGSAALARYTGGGGRVWRQENADWEYGTPDARAGWVKDSKGRWRIRIAQNWRAFGSWRESVRDQWARWILRADYTKVRAALERGDAAGYARELRAVRYYTLDAAEYSEALAGVLVRARSFFS